MRTVTVAFNAFCYSRDYKRIARQDPFASMIGSDTAIDYTIELSGPIETAPPEPKRESFSFERKLGYWGSSRHDFFRRTSKCATLRSYRQPRSIGGDNRKAAVRKLLRRLTPKQLSLAPFENTHILAG